VRGLAWFHAVVGASLLGPSSRAREQALQARTTVLEERTKLAHELHDAVGHTVTLMTVQAGAGRKVFESDPVFARSSLETIEVSGRRALAELDHILGLLRADEGGGSAPPAGLGRLPDLVQEVGEAGLTATLEIEGDRPPLPQGMDSTAYRIVQEALTNVLKHAASAPATIRVEYQRAAMIIEVIDSGPVGSSSESERAGQGLIGMRERAAVFGAEIELGPLPGGGYRVWVRFPLDG
jgi:signal transduction histidine kinase